MSLMVASTRWKDEPSCSCSCDAPWLDWLCSGGAKPNVASENKVREMQSFIFLLQEIWFETVFGEAAVNPERRKLSDWRLRRVKQPLCMREISRSQGRAGE